MKGLFYLLQVAGNGPVKAGFTTNMSTRLIGLQAWCPYELEQRALIPADSIVEKYALEILRPHRIRGEWFEPHPFVLNFVDSVVKAGSVPGAPEATPSRAWGQPQMTYDFSKCIPRIWPSLSAMEAEVDRGNLRNVFDYTEGVLARVIIAARKHGVELRTSDLLRQITPRPTKAKAA